ncbi:Uncharacterised protein [Chlamydia abortus]|uniref:Uncharacterized protein n=1 Tax=Paenibacillus residui TaxID=629724 RepID=A0ABW3DFD1_9BACL|nr:MULTISPECIES: hypothetical protein [Paenibacillaceae]SHE14571.1 Uncharacterised protein [Chlamydia abortus]
MKNKKKRNEETGPTLAPGMNMHDEMEEEASEREIEQGESTSVTRLYLDRTPED